MAKMKISNEDNRETIVSVVEPSGTAVQTKILKGGESTEMHVRSEQQIIIKEVQNG